MAKIKTTQFFRKYSLPNRPSVAYYNRTGFRTLRHPDTGNHITEPVYTVRSGSERKQTVYIEGVAEQTAIQVCKFLVGIN